MVPKILKKNDKNEVYKFCVDCEHFQPENSNAIYGKCTAFPKIESFKKVENDYMVSGVLSREKFEYFYCSTARGSESMCGKNANKFKANQ